MLMQTLGINSVEGMPELAESDMVVFLGDLNYRLDDISYDEARDFISQRCFDWLRERDQLHAEMKAGNVFQGMREAIIRFPPTYKFEKHQAGLAGTFCYTAGFLFVGVIGMLSELNLNVVLWFFVEPNKVESSNPVIGILALTYSIIEDVEVCF